ncbi:F-box/FBD/LRR-repeat protein At1g13570-like [Panicum hallii]|nr:F-box/FBD/LRR-repeat protein At1g13570-like [Panicum hallii]
MARRAPFSVPDPATATACGPHELVRDPEQLLSYIRSCAPEPPVSTTAGLAARRASAADPDGIDRISGLSDALLRDIVSRLPCKDAARTAVLAARWRGVWLAAPLAVVDAHLLGRRHPASADAAAAAVTAAVSRALAAHPGPFRCAHLVSGLMDARQPHLKRWLRLLAAKGVQELVLVNRPCPREVPLPDTLFRIATLTRLYIGFWKFPRAASLQGASFPNLRELGVCSVVVEDGDIDSLVARSTVLEILNIQGSVKGLRLVSRSLRCVQICASVVESIAVVSTPCLDRLILWEVRGSPNPASGLRTRIKIGIAPKLRILGYLDPAQHLLEIGGTVIMAGIKPSASTIHTSVKTLSLTVCFGSNGAMMVPAILKCFPNVEALHIMSAKCDEPANRLNLKLWQEADPILSVLLRIKVMTIREFRGEQHELAFLQFFYQNARVLKDAAIVSANVRVTRISDKQMFSIIQNMDDSRWASKFGLAILGSNGPEGGRPWMFQRGANFSDDDPFAPIKFIGNGPASATRRNKTAGTGTNCI